MHPTLFTIPLPEFLTRLLGVNTITVYTYAFCIVLATVISCMYIKSVSKKTLNNLALPNSFFYKMFFAGFVGGKIFYYLEKPVYYFQHPNLLLNNFSGGFVVYGSIIFIALFTVLYSIKNKIAVYGLLDIMAIAAVLPMALGRVGCFFGGCCYGKPTDSFLGIVFPATTPFAVHPTQLYDAAMLAIVLTGLLIMNKHKKTEGQVFLLYIILYAVERFVLEFLRGDFRGTVFNGLISHAQAISVAAFVIAFILFNKLKKQNQSFTLKIIT
jgi:phosphatidylglycerol---prolipoprotein diacylglyceryl transferase